MVGRLRSLYSFPHASEARANPSSSRPHPLPWVVVLKTWAAQVKATWDEASKEHVFSYREAGTRVEQKVGYPTPLFLKTRMDVATELGVAGVAIWELGQGLRAFMDLF